MTSPATSGCNRALAASLGITLLSLCSVHPGFAQDSAPQRLTPEQQERIFPEGKTEFVRHQRERIRIMQSGERCMSAARDVTALKQCQRQERQQNQTERQKHREAMRAIYVRNGIEVPVGGPGGRGSGAGGRGAGGGGGKGQRAL